jgi:hypothetical protein
LGRPGRALREKDRTPTLDERIDKSKRAKARAVPGPTVSLVLVVVSLTQVAITVSLLTALGFLAIVVLRRTLGKASFQGPYAIAFASLVTGILGAVFAFSVLRTNGHTSSWVMLIPTIAAIWAWPKGAYDPRENRIGRGTVLFLGLAIALSVAWFAPRTMTAPDSVLRAQGRDDAFYTSVVEALLDRGVETTASLEALLPGTTVQPRVYHYFELWLGAFISWLWRTPPVLALGFHADVVLLVTVMTGLAAILEHVRRPTRAVLATALLLPFLVWWVPGVLLDALLFRELRNWQAALVIGGPPKLLPAYIFGIASILGLRSQRPVLAVAAAALGTCANISFAPFFLGALAGGGLQFYRNNKRDLAEVVPFLMAACGPILFLGYFQFAGGTPTAFASGPLDGFGWDALRVSRNIVVKSVFYCVVFFGFPILVGLGRADFVRLLKTSFSRPVVVMLLLSVSSGLGVWALLHRWDDSVQFFMNPSVVAGNLACILAFATRPLDRRLQVLVLAFWGLATKGWMDAASDIVLPASGDESYMSAIRREGPFLPRVGAFIISKEAAKRRPPWELYPPIMSPGSLSTTTCCAGALPLVDLASLIRGNAQLEISWRESAFVRFSAERSLDLDDERGLEEAQRSFATHYRLRFVVVAENTPVPDWVKSATERSYADRVTGERFFVIRTSP